MQKKLVMDYDTKISINIIENTVQHSKTKHIDIKHHLIRELGEHGLVDLEYVTTQKQMADILTKSFDAMRFEELLLGNLMLE